ncbi:MAG: radical SAM protein [Candidatus Hodarchaeota archaeon]
MEEIGSLSDIEHYSNYFHDIWKDGKPLCKLFKTDTAYYLYDAGTNKILGCDELKYNLLEKLKILDIDDAIYSFMQKYYNKQFLKTAKKIKDIMEAEKILQLKKVVQIGNSKPFENIEDKINNHLGLVQLELTERCNLRCEYCVYNEYVKGKRNHGNRDMSRAIAFAAIDYLKKHSSKKDEVAVTFYGGEPLLRFPLIQSCVNYAHKVFGDKKVRFSLTTNATLLTSEIAKFLFAEKNFSVVVSLDGPAEIHDSYRKDYAGNGSFKQTLKGLKYLYDTFGDSFKHRISFSAVYAPPYSEKKLNSILKFREKNTWIKYNSVNFTYPSPGSIPMSNFPKNKPLENKPLLQWAQEKYWQSYIGKTDILPIVKDVIERSLALIFRRLNFQEPVHEFNLNGCCRPGVRKLFASVDGAFHICEQVSGAPGVGNVFSGINIDTIKRNYLEEYAEKSLPYCSNCWAIRRCNVCYNSCFTDGKIDMDKKLDKCRNIRPVLLEHMKYFCRLLEYNSEGLNYLAKFTLE